MFRFVYFFVCVVILTPLWLPAQMVFIEQGSAMRYLANASDPGIGIGWTADGFDDSSWATGTYGTGFDDNGQARLLIDTAVPVGTLSTIRYSRVAVSIR